VTLGDVVVLGMVAVIGICAAFAGAALVLLVAFICRWLERVLQRWGWL
jgi:hypothetical protein